MNQPYSAMRNNIHMLGDFLGETIREAQGNDILELIESIRVLSKILVPAMKKHANNY
ncbi:phosphoenolpyruvate carboxylase [Actinobacillus equuli]|nr:phosphoenolpyruvate carboxylase [Actinobacillus equuli]